MQVKLPILERAPHERSHFSFRAPTIQELHGYKFVELTRFLRGSSFQSLREGVGSAGPLTKRQPVDALHGLLFDFFEGHESIRAQNAGGLATTRHGQLLRVDGTRFAKYLEFDFASPFSNPVWEQERSGARSRLLISCHRGYPLSKRHGSFLLQ